MKYLDEFRDQIQAKQIGAAIAREAGPSRCYRLMEFCGGHTHAIFRYGIQALLPGNVEFIHGPGCPVCVLPMARLDQAMQLAVQYDVILCSYGDMLRVPGEQRRTLMQSKADGADIRMIYSTQDALQIARDNPQRQVVFFAIGFETTTPPTAVAIKQAASEELANFTVFCNHVLTPPAMRAILDSPEPVQIDAFLGPSHVSTVIGSAAYKPIAMHYHKPIVIAGFEPLDVMQSALMAIRLLNQKKYVVENEYSRAVTHAGNQKAQALMNEVFELRDTFEWRGLGSIPNSALRINSAYSYFDAERRFTLKNKTLTDVKGCDCAEIIRGHKKPHECKLFGTVCTPDNPMGSCMVSSEGACAAYWRYGRVA
jgi:hydrogenase expression/formation protein HypD